MNADEFREFGHRTVDLFSDYLEHIEERPLFADVEPAKLNNLFAGPLPQNPSSSAEVLQEIQEKLLPYCTHVGHPNFGLITPSPNSMGILADFICSALNQNVGAYTIGLSAVAMERRTVQWLAELVGYGEQPEAILPAVEPWRILSG